MLRKAVVVVVRTTIKVGVIAVAVIIITTTIRMVNKFIHLNNTTMFVLIYFVNYFYY